MPLILLDAVLLPGEEMALHIRDRSMKQLVADCQATNGLFIAAKEQDVVELGYGVAGLISKIIRKYPNGDMDIQIKATEIVHIDRYYERHPLKLYAAAVVTTIATSIYSADRYLINEFKKFAFRYLPKSRLKATISGDMFEIAVMLGLTDEQKLRMLRLFNVIEMNNFLINVMRTRAALINQEAQLQGNYFLN